MHKYTHTRARAPAGGGGGVRTGSHVHAENKSTQNLSISLPSSLSLYLSLPLSILLFLCHACTLSRARMLRHMHEWKLALFRFSEVTVCWLCFFSPLTDSTTISLCKPVALLTGNVFFFHHALSVPNYSYRLPMSIFIILFFFFSCAVEGIRQWRQWQSHSLQPQLFHHGSMCNGYKKYWRENWEYNCGMCSFFHHGSEEQHLNLST